MKFRKVFPHAFLAVLVVVFVWLNNSSLKQNKVAQPVSTVKRVSVVRDSAEVTRIVDGDTIEVDLDSKKETVRLIGIDSPEVVGEKKPAQCFGQEASVKAKDVLTGQTIILESDPTQGDRDEYRRLLRYVFLDGLNFNKLMLNEGFAREYTFKGKVYKYQAEFIQAERDAVRKNRGLWALC